MDLYAKRIDRRTCDPEYGVFTGFSAIHYAIISESYDAVKLLIDQEYFCRIPKDIMVLAPSIGPKAQFVVREGMNILHLAFLVGNVQIIDYILNYVHQSGLSLVGVPDSYGFFAVGMLFIVGTNENVIRHLHSERMEEEILYSYTGTTKAPNHIFNAALYGRYMLIEHLLDYIQSTKCTIIFAERIYRLVLQVEEGRYTCLDAARIPMSRKRCYTNPAERQRCIEALEKLVQLALDYFTNCDRRDQDMVGRFLAAVEKGKQLSLKPLQSQTGIDYLQEEALNSLNLQRMMSRTMALSSSNVAE